MPNAQVYIIHGYGASAQHHWFPWLKQELNHRNIPVHIPSLPKPEHPVKQEWDDRLKTTIGTPDEHTYFVAHSLGCIALLDYLQQLEPQPKLGGLILVAGFCSAVPGYSLINPFIAHTLHADRIIAITDYRVVIAAYQDPIVPFERCQELATALKAKLITLQYQTHFLGSDGFTKLPIVMDQLSLMINHSKDEQPSNHNQQNII